MSKQKVVILVLSIIGLASTFLPWIKGLFGVTLNEISSISGDKSGIWVVIVCFIIVSLLCLVNKQFVLRGWALFGALLPAIITIAVSIFYLAMDLNSRMIDYFLDIDDASELGLRLGPAPYIVLIAASLIAVFGIALKPKKMIIQILEFEGSLKELYNDFLNKRVHIICPAVNGETTYNEFILRIGGMSTEEANNIVDIANQNNEVITLWP